MRFKNVCIESIGFCLPEHRVTSSDIEAQLAPLYHRLRLPEGRLELMTLPCREGVVSAPFTSFLSEALLEGLEKMAANEARTTGLPT